MMIILLNKHSNNSHGPRKWEEVRVELEEKYIGHDYRLIYDAEDLPEMLRRTPAAGQHTVVAAGGDGTVNFLLNRLMRLEENERRRIIMGAIGLGSSNDFHKPVSDRQRVNGKVHVKLDDGHATAQNVGQVTYEDVNGKPRQKYFMINSSIGIIAQANHFFNVGNGLLNWLKPRCVLGAIYYAALKTIFSAPNVPAVITVDGERLATQVTTLSVLINPFFSGNLSYDIDVNPQSPFFGVALGERMGTAERLRALFSLARSRFQGLAKTRVWKAGSVEIQTDSPIPLELDGEVELAWNIRIRLLQGYMRVCQ
jgi:diacylglycerol kinase (ATP)